MTIFSEIAAGNIPCYKCAENEHFFAFLDINPVAMGHTLVIPKREVDYIFDLEDDELAQFQVFAKKVAVAIKKAIPCKKGGSMRNRFRSASCTYSLSSYANRS